MLASNCPSSWGPSCCSVIARPQPGWQWEEGVDFFVWKLRLCWAENCLFALKISGFFPSSSSLVPLWVVLWSPPTNRNKDSTPYWLLLTAAGCSQINFSWFSSHNLQIKRKKNSQISVIRRKSRIPSEMSDGYNLFTNHLETIKVRTLIC